MNGCTSIQGQKVRCEMEKRGEREEARLGRHRRKQGFSYTIHHTTKHNTGKHTRRKMGADVLVRLESLTLCQGVS